MQVFKAAGISPEVMVKFFDKVAADQGRDAPRNDLGRLGIAIASHPADAQRAAFFRNAATR